MNIESALAHHLWLREQLLVQCPDLADDEAALADTLEGISDLDQAIAAVVHSIDDDEAMVAGCEARAAEIEARKARFKYRIETKRRILASVMERANIAKVMQPDFSLSLAKAPRRVIVTDEALVPAAFKVTPDPKISKSLIKVALDKGEKVPGAELSNGGVAVTIRRK